MNRKVLNNQEGSTTIVPAVMYGVSLRLQSSIKKKEESRDSGIIKDFQKTYESEPNADHIYVNWSPPAFAPVSTTGSTPVSTTGIRTPPPTESPPPPPRSNTPYSDFFNNIYATPVTTTGIRTPPRIYANVNESSPLVHDEVIYSDVDVSGSTMSSSAVTPTDKTEYAIIDQARTAAFKSIKDTRELEHLEKDDQSSQERNTKGPVSGKLHLEDHFKDDESSEVPYTKLTNEKINEIFGDEAKSIRPYLQDATYNYIKELGKGNLKIKVAAKEAGSKDKEDVFVYMLGASKKVTKQLVKYIKDYHKKIWQTEISTINRRDIANNDKDTPKYAAKSYSEKINQKLKRFAYGNASSKTKLRMALMDRFERPAIKQSKMAMKKRMIVD